MLIVKKVMDQKLSFKSKFEFVIDRYVDVYNRIELEGRMPFIYKTYYEYLLHVLTCCMYQEYIDEKTSNVCNKLRRQRTCERIGACGTRYYHVRPLKCPCGYTFIDLDRYKPDPHQTLVQYLAGTLSNGMSFVLP